MIKVPLGHNRFALIDDEDAELILALTWHAMKSRNTFYARHTISKAGPIKGQRIHTPLLLHRVVMRAREGTEIDHEDGDGLNCQKKNLRIATPAQNRHNAQKHRDNKSGYKGVFFHRDGRPRPYQVAINKTYIGAFSTAEEGARAYDRKAKELFGQFARLNFPEV